MSWHWTWTITLEHIATSERADKAIPIALEAGYGHWTQGQATQPGSFTRSQIQRLIDEGKALGSDGKPLKANTKLKAGNHIKVEFPPAKPLELIPENRPLDILFEDEHLLIVNKPPALTVHPSDTQTEGTLVHALLHHIKDLSGIGGILRPGIVHRLDKDTSGALVITKTDATHVALSAVFARHDIERRYWALCYGDVETPELGLKIESLLGRNPNDRKKMAMNVKEGRNAITWVTRLEAYGQPTKKPFASLVEAKLETGRTHQVRVHLTGIGHSILGDPGYGSPSDRHPKWLALPEEIRELVTKLPGQALHARVLGFKHPITGKELRFEAEPPEAFRLLLEGIKRYS